MPITSHVSLIVSPALSRVRNPWTTFGFAGSLVSMPCMPSRVHTGVRLPNDLRPVNLIAAGHLFGLRDRHEDRRLVAALGMPGREHFALGRVSKNPFADLSPARQLIGGVADPVVVHVDAQRGRGRVLGQPPRLARDLGEREAVSAEFLRHGHLEIAGRLELVEIFLTEAIVAVVARRSLAALVQ